MRPEISVIVPVYNAEAYLERCVNSILRQDFSNFELLLIDDGSAAACADLCDALATLQNGYASFETQWKITHYEAKSY